MNWKFFLECTHGGFGWGETGQKAYLVVKGNSLEEATHEAKMTIPGGWTLSFVCNTAESPSLCHIE